ncbi:hydroxyacid dehydrogenase [Candidatus Bipolaricaulota bacterium]|nr:hydroxyacid dehydrogenase [Candidatus Bipolaricaulota bacterium]
MEKPKVLLLEAEDRFAFFQELKEIADLSFKNKKGGYTEEDLLQIIGPYHAVMITSQHAITSRVIAAAPKLRIIAKRGAKPENVDYEAATKRGIVVAWTPGVNYVTVAEHAVMLILCLAKKVLPQMERLRGGAWRESDAGLQELCGKTIGIVGLGGIGKALCRMLNGFDVNLLTYDPYISPAQAGEFNANLVSFKDLLEQSDYITLHAALTDKTRHLIGEQEFSMMKKTAYLVNTARGGLIDESALVKALQNGEIAGAGLDVFEPEPPRHENPLLHLPNVVVTPHMAGWSEEALYRELKEAAIEIRLVLEGGSPHYPLNPEALENRKL